MHFLAKGMQFSTYNRTEQVEGAEGRGADNPNTYTDQVNENQVITTNDERAKSKISSL